jgi:flagellar hook-length control protein FliK
MTMMLNTVTTSASANGAAANGPAGAPVSAAAQPADNSAAAASAGQPGQSGPAGAAGAAAAGVNPQLFAQWLGQQAAGMQAADGAQAAAPSQSDAAGGAAPAADAQADAKADDATAAGAVPDGALLAAMAMPLMPLSPVQVAQAVQAAQGNGQPAQNNGKASANDAAPAVAAVGQDGARRAAAQGALPALAPLPSQQPLPQAQAAGAAQPAQAADTAAVRVAVQAAAGAAGDAAAQDGNADQSAPAPVAPQAGFAQVSTPAAAQPAPDAVKLAGPPTAWRQSLQEALGERLHLQVGNNVEQAVIRLEPPQLGRIDIAIRHSAGSLEVNISATNGDVLRQLQTVSDNLRSDLSQRQFSEVAVTVTPAPKNGATPFGDPQQQQNRGRQQERDQDDYEPGRALAEAGNPASAFSLGGRDRA